MYITVGTATISYFKETSGSDSASTCGQSFITWIYQREKLSKYDENKHETYPLDILLKT